MSLLTEQWEALLSFFDTGGSVLVAIFFTTLFMWMLISERLLYWRFVFPAEMQRTLESGAR